MLLRVKGSGFMIYSQSIRVEGHSGKVEGGAEISKGFG